MGVTYRGPYANQLDSHEGYAARVLPDGELTGTWTTHTVVFLAHVAACGCGWTGPNRHAPTEDGEDAALEEWRREHLDPLIATAAREGWPAWAERTASRAAGVAAHVAAGRVDLAVELMNRLEADVQAWARIVDRLAEDQAAGGAQ